MRLKRNSAWTLLPLLFFASNGAHATLFENQFAKFELPPSWSCTLEGAEWVCQSSDESKKKEAIIVLAAKLKGDQDSLDQYLTYLKAAKSYTSVAGKPMKSEPKYAKTVNLNGEAWVDALHLESEIPGFYTRYLATVKDDIGVLVTYSISKAKYQEYLQPFENMVRTLRVFRKAGGINTGATSGIRGQEGNLIVDTKIPGGVGESTVFGNTTTIAGGSDQPRSGGGQAAGGSDDLFLYGLIAAAAVVFIILKKRKG